MLSRRYSRKKCPKGSISRSGYTKKNGVKVKSTCVKSKALRSRGKIPKRKIPSLKSGMLTRYGYHVLNKKDERIRSLKKAVKEYGYSSVIKRLNAVRVLTKNTNPKISNKYYSDMNTLKTMYR